MIDFSNIRGTQIRAQSSPWRAGVELVIAKSAALAIGPSAVFAKEVVFETEEEANQSLTKNAEPVLSLRPDAAQVLMDDLWACGFRPTEGTGSAGALAATQKHLEDMRKIAFRELGNV